MAGSLFAAFGPRAYFGALGTLTGALTVYDLWRKARRAAVPREQKGPFINTQQIVTCAGLGSSPPESSPEPLKAAAVAPSSP
jgi:hypothetical protein